MPRNPLKGAMKFVSPNIRAEKQGFMEKFADIQDDLIRKMGQDPVQFRKTANRRQLDRLIARAREIAMRGSKPQMED